jgi:hypothetical protein
MQEATVLVVTIVSPPWQQPQTMLHEHEKKILPNEFSFETDYLRLQPRILEGIPLVSPAKSLLSSCPERV